MRPAPRPRTPERDHQIRSRAAIILAVAALVFGLPLILNLPSAARAVADVVLFR